MHTEQWQLAAHALNGTGGFDNGEMLIKYSRETDQKYDSRKEVAYYINHMKRSCQRFVSYLSKQPASRNTSNRLVQSVIENCDMKGNHISQFMQDFSVQAKARGCGLVLVDMPKDDGQSKSEEDQLKERRAPYFVPIEPERVTEYKKDRFGGLEYIDFTDQQTVGGELKTVTRRYSKTGWRVTHKEEIIDQGEYSIGTCPVIGFGESGKFPALGSYYPIAELSQRLYNAQSELDEILRGQTFSILAYHIPPDAGNVDAESIGSTIGTQNMLLYHDKEPSFVTPASIPAKTYQDYISELEERINTIANNVDLGAQQQSGAALALRFQNMNSDLLNFARRLEDFERRLFDVVALWLKVTNDVDISYPSDYNMVDKKLEIEVLQNMQAAGAPHGYLKEKMRQIIASDLIGMDAETEAQIMAEIDEVEHERPA